MALAAVPAHVRQIAVVHVKLTLHGNLLLVLEPHVLVLVLIVAKLLVILQAPNPVLQTVVPIVQPNATTDAHHAQGAVQEVAGAIVVQQNVLAVVKPTVQHHVAFNVLKAHIVIKYND